MEIVAWLRSEILDAKTCETCEQLDGILLPADDPAWNGPLGELAHPNCRAMWIPIYDMGTLDFTAAEAIPELITHGGFHEIPETWEEYPSPIEGLRRMRRGVITLDEEMDLLEPFELLASYLGLLTEEEYLGLMGE